MRNALVLVPLCYGLTFGFIVPTSTSVMKTFTESTLMLESETTLSHSEDETANKTINLTKSDFLQTENVKEADIQKEVYAYGSEEAKNINGRSFVFVNHPWKKISFKNQLVETIPLSSNLYSDIKIHNSKGYEEAQTISTKSILDKMSNTHIINNTNQKNTENNRFTNKSYFPPVDNFDSNTYNNHNKKINHESFRRKDYANLNSNLSRNFSLVDLSHNNKIRIYNDPKYKHMYPRERNKGRIIDFSPINKYEKTIDNEVNDKYNKAQNLEENTHEHEQTFELKKDSLRAGLPKNNEYNNQLKNLRYCQECIWKAKTQTDGFDVECKCKCGRYIHLRGSPDLLDYAD